MATPILQQISRLNGGQFEKLCALLIEAAGFRNVIPRKSGSQSGRDIDADIVDPKTQESERWYFECKGYERGSTVPFKEIVTKLLLIHRLAPIPNALVVVCSSQLSNDSNDYIDNFAADLDFPIIRITNEPPTMLFDQWVLEHQDKVLGFLNGIAPTDRDPSHSAVQIADYLWNEKKLSVRPMRRTERALSLHAFPKLTFLPGRITGHFVKLDGRIDNVGNGFAHSIGMTLIHQGATIYEAEFTALGVGSFVEFEAQTTIDGSIGKTLVTGASDPLTVVLTYKNALDYVLQSSYTISATKGPMHWEYGRPRAI